MSRAPWRLAPGDRVRPSGRTSEGSHRAPWAGAADGVAPQPQSTPAAAAACGCAGVVRTLADTSVQVLQRRWDVSFSDHSYGFRPGRSAHQAVARAQQYIVEGYECVVDLDLEKFFGASGKAWRFQRVKFPPWQGERAAPPGIGIPRLCGDLRSPRNSTPSAASHYNSTSPHDPLFGKSHSQYEYTAI